jgi:hypothetical protein
VKPYRGVSGLEPRAKLMQEWADFLEQTQRNVKVLPFKGTAVYCT